MQHFRTVLTSIFLFVSCTTMLHAASDNFTVRTLIGDDTTPPTVPQNLVATPIATSQIDLTWSSSTDNWVLAGYQVFRATELVATTAPLSFSQIATTTAPNYSDVGLTASTTYHYFVTAFDTSDNISASSSVASTTTFASTTPPATSTPTDEDGSISGTRVPLPELLQLEIIPAQNSVTLRYKTTGHVRSVVRWGETLVYELGSSKEHSFRRSHETIITGLRPGTKYFFSIEGENSAGTLEIMTANTFTTLPPDDVLPPGNVTGLRGWIDGNDIALSWNNPPETDFSHVRVLRSDRFYPVDAADGWLVYEGDEEFARDLGVANENKTQYYTVFSYDTRGNISSGAVVAVAPKGDVPKGDLVAPPSTEDKEGAPEVKLIDFNFGDIVFTQDGTVLPNNGRQITVDGTKQLRVSVPYERMPKHLKTILIEIGRNQGGSDAFLLRIDEERAFYTTTLSAFTYADSFPVTVAVYDFETFRVGTASGEIISTISRKPVEDESSGFLGYLGSYFNGTWWVYLSYSLLLLLLILLLVFLYYQATHAKD